MINIVRYMIIFLIFFVGFPIGIGVLFGIMHLIEKAYNWIFSSMSYEKRAIITGTLAWAAVSAIAALAVAMNI